MKDETYAAELLTILTDQRPTAVRVVSVDITRGEHGLELEVAFGLKGPHDMPGRGSVRVPFDRHWRRLSGYETPAAYAPEVARQVQLAADRQVAEHRAGPRQARPLAREAQWQLLLDALAERGPVRETGPGRIEVGTGDDMVTVLVSPDEWEHVLAHTDDVGLFLDELIGPRDEDERFVVCFKGDLVRSIREELPPVRGRAHERLLAEHRGDLYWTGPSGDLST